TGKIPTFSLGRDKFNFLRNIHLADLRFHISSDIDLLIEVDLFWNLICVGQVKSTTSQNSQRRYIVKLPVREQMLNNIGDSRESALKRLRGIERHFKRDPCNLTHCGRNFNASQTRLQRILWRNNPSANVNTYELTTITYGTASASFLATRCLKHLAEQDAHQFTRGLACVLRDFYVDKCSNLNKICRIIAYCLRLSKVHREHRIFTFVSAAEVSTALDCICRTVQQRAFYREYEALVKNEIVNTSSNILSLSPFLDESGLMRIGGIEREHTRNLHAGLPRWLLCANAFGRYRCDPRGILQKCVTCFKAKPNQSETLMGSLPASRVNVSRSIFLSLWHRLCRAALLRKGRRRNAQVRRGRPANVYSDNGTTFVGAHKQIQDLYDMYNDPQVQSEIKNFLRELEISWSFIPPNAPHFGGLWKAAVKSTKYHMTRIVGKAHLTFEEMQTTLCEIEAILNSRPLLPLSADPNDLAYLSPGHFLVGTTLNGLPCVDLSDVNENRLLRWQRVKQIRQHFWRRWSEYLHSLQTRIKWMARDSKGTQLSTNQLVLIRQPNLTSLQWAMGRVLEVHPDPDGIARTATAKGSYMRPLSKLLILSI
ncbi:hypothetical protein ALC53_10162, partial [Atta colombica]